MHLIHQILSDFNGLNFETKIISFDEAVAYGLQIISPTPLKHHASRLTKPELGLGILFNYPDYPVPNRAEPDWSKYLWIEYGLKFLPDGIFRP